MCVYHYLSLSLSLSPSQSYCCHGYWYGSVGFLWQEPVRRRSDGRAFAATRHPTVIWDTLRCQHTHTLQLVWCDDIAREREREKLKLRLLLSVLFPLREIAFSCCIWRKSLNLISFFVSIVGTESFVSGIDRDCKWHLRDKNRKKIRRRIACLSYRSFLRFFRFNPLCAEHPGGVHSFLEN